jgi:hypothetical protein
VRRNEELMEGRQAQCRDVEARLAQIQVTTALSVVLMAPRFCRPNRRGVTREFSCHTVWDRRLLWIGAEGE